MLATAGNALLSGPRRSLSLRRLKRKPESRHIRKPSVSDSVSSVESSSARSTQSLSSQHHDETVEFDSLHLHPTFRPPARLFERPYITSDDEPPLSREEEEAWRFLREERARLETKELPAPPVDSPTPLNSNHEVDEAADYFTFRAQQQPRPQLPRSHWSESTINTMLDATPAPQDEREVRPVQWQNFSYKRGIARRRPPMGPADSVENFIKRGGWKRRGIVFQQDAEGHASHESLI